MGLGLFKRLPKCPLRELLWSLTVGILGIIDCSWGVYLEVHGLFFAGL